MKLEQLLSVIDETCDVMVWAHDSEDKDDILVSSYNGKESIDPKFNSETVEFVSAYTEKGIDIVLALTV